MKLEEIMGEGVKELHLDALEELRYDAGRCVDANGNPKRVEFLGTATITMDIPSVLERKGAGHCDIIEKDGAKKQYTLAGSIPESATHYLPGRAVSDVEMRSHHASGKNAYACNITTIPIIFLREI